MPTLKIHAPTQCFVDFYTKSRLKPKVRKIEQKSCQNRGKIEEKSTPNRKKIDVKSQDDLRSPKNSKKMPKNAKKCEKLRKMVPKSSVPKITTVSAYPPPEGAKPFPQARAWWDQENKNPTRWGERTPAHWDAPRG